MRRGGAAMKVIFLGATKGMGRALARRMARRGDVLFLLGRDAESLARSVADLAVDGATPAGHARCDLTDTSTFAPALDAAERALGGVDAVVVTAGEFATQAVLEEDLDLAEQVLSADFTGTVLFCEHA